MKKIILSLVIVLMLVMMALLAANLPPAVVAQPSPPLSLECDISPWPTTKVGHVTNFTAEAGGGVGNYTWLWTVNGTPVATTQNTTYTFNTTGIHTVCINVTDSSDNKKQCCKNVTVNPPLSLECWVSPNPTKVGHVTNFTAKPVGVLGITPGYGW